LSIEMTHNHHDDVEDFTYAHQQPWRETESLSYESVRWLQQDDIDTPAPTASPCRNPAAAATRSPKALTGVHGYS
jgi:hypothetical protein